MTASISYHEVESNYGKTRLLEIKTLNEHLRMHTKFMMALRHSVTLYFFCIKLLFDSHPSQFFSFFAWLLEGQFEGNLSSILYLFHVYFFSFEANYEWFISPKLFHLENVRRCDFSKDAFCLKIAGPSNMNDATCFTTCFTLPWTQSGEVKVNLVYFF